MKEEIIQNSFEEKKSLSDFSLQEYKEILRRSNKLGRDGRKLFNDLARESLYKPDFKDPLEPNGDDRVGIDFGFNDNNEHRIEKKEFLKMYSAPSDEFFSYPEADGVMQKRERRYAQEGGTNIIDETIYNYARDNSDERVVKSELLIRNRENGLSLDFSRLVPNQYSFISAALVEKARMKKVNLEVYENEENNDDFSLNYSTKQVVYGDLSKKGKILSLFHEIAHSWQAVYHRESAKYNYQEFINSVLGRLSRLKDAVSDEEQTENQKKNAKVMHDLLKKTGVELDLENFYKKVEPKKDEYRLFNQAKNCFYVIKSKKLKELIAKYQLEERNAWAHAIKMLRFFRKEGFDLEPGLQKIGEIEEYIRNYLDTYQKNMEEVIQGNDKKVKFL